MRVRACRYRCGRDCVWACSAAGREADSPLERARPLRAGGQSGGCPGLHVLDARARAPGPELPAKPSRCLPAGLAFRELGRGCGCSGGQTGPTQAAGLAGSRTWSLWPPRVCVTSLGRFLVPKVGCTSPAWLVERLTHAGLGKSQQMRTLKARPGAQRGGAFSRACTAPTPSPRQARPAAPSSGEASARFLFA